MAYTFPNIFMTPELGGNVGLLDDEIQKALQQCLQTISLGIPSFLGHY